MTAHLSLPLRVSGTGALAAHPVGSPAEVGQSVALLSATRVGERRSEPAYGSRDMLFRPQPNVGIDYDAIATWEPRATAAILDIVLDVSGRR